MTSNIFNPADPSSPGHYGPSQTALLLLDFHTKFIELSGPKGAEALEIAIKMKNWAQFQGIPVLHCLLDLNASPFPTCKDGNRFAQIAEAMRTSGGEEPERLRGNSNNGLSFLRRPGLVSALKSPGLIESLKKKGIKSLVLAGLSTSGCVMRTALSASDEEFVITVLTDGCMDPVEGLHDVVVGKLLNRGWVASAEEFREGYSVAQGLKMV